MKKTPKNIKTVKKNEIFVFGSNMKGGHLGGAAYFALKRAGAIMYQPIGIQGRSYGLPTLDYHLKKLDLIFIREQIKVLAMVISLHPEKTFYITEVGCGIAGFSPKEIGPLFFDFIGFTNITLPQSFISEILLFRTRLLTQISEDTPMETYGKTMVNLFQEYRLPIKFLHEAYYRIKQ